jgi:hypothetical protein
MPLDLHAICTRIGLPQARAGDLERSLISGKTYGLFAQSTPLTWQLSDSTLALKLTPFYIAPAFIGYGLANRLRDESRPGFSVIQSSTAYGQIPLYSIAIKGDWGQTRPLIKGASNHDSAL